MSAGRRRLFQFGLLLFSLILCAGGLEIGARLFWELPVHPIGAAEHLSEPWPYTFRLKPNEIVRVRSADIPATTIRLNQHGFRGPPVESIADDPVRVVSIGDSFTFGWGVEMQQQCFVAAVDAYAKSHPGVRVGQSTVAEPGWGPRDYFFGYVDQARAIRPDVVILGFFCGDDIVPPGMIRSIGSGPPPARAGSRTRSWLHSQGLEWLRFKIRSSPGLTRGLLWLGVRPTLELQRFLREEPPPLPEMWNETLGLLSAMNGQVRRDGGTLIIAAFPSLIQVYGRAGLDDEKFDYRHVEKRLAAFCEAEGIVFVPFLDALLADGKPDLYYPVDRHLTPRGHAICRDVLLEKLTPILDGIARRKAAKPSGR